MVYDSGETLLSQCTDKVKSVSRFIGVHLHPLSFFLAFAFLHLIFLQAFFFFRLPIPLPLFPFLVHLSSLHLAVTYVIPPPLHPLGVHQTTTAYRSIWYPKPNTIAVRQLPNKGKGPHTPPSPFMHSQLLV